MNKNFFPPYCRSQRGEILLTTLIFVMLGFLIIVPLVAFMGTGLKTSRVFNQKSTALYSADAGIEDAIWQIKYEHLSSTLTNPTEYDEFDFTTAWLYPLSELPNQKVVNVTIQNVWVPMGIAALSESEARAVANSGRLMVTGGMVGGTETEHKVTITYNPQVAENLLIDTIGIWLPPGFAYETGSSSVEQATGQPYHSIPVVTPHKGGYAVVWSFSALDILSFPGVDTLDSPMTFDLSFSFLPDVAEAQPDVVSWLETSGVEDLGFCWDFDVKVFKIVAQSDQTSVENYVAKTDLRQLNGVLNGDYYATGNTLMRDAYYDNNHIRETWLDAVNHSSSSTVTAIDNEAEVAAAFLYWTAWQQESQITTVAPLNPEDCDDFTSWTASSPNSWSVYYSGSDYAFYSHYNSNDNRDLTSNTIDLSAHSNAKVALTWEQKVGGTTTLFSNNCASTSNWTLGADWVLYSEKYRAHHSSGSDTDRMITSTQAMDLSAYASQTVTIRWNQTEEGTLEPEDKLYFAYSGDNGSNWSANILAFADDNPTNPIGPQTIPAQYLTKQFKIRFYIASFGDYGEYAYVDNIAISCTFTPTYSATDGLNFAIYNSDTGWSNNVSAFRGSIGTSFIKYHFFLPPQYITSSFKVRFSLADCGETAEGLFIDNIYLKVMLPDNQVFFKVNNQQVYYDAQSEPVAGSGELTADKTDVILNITSNVYKGFSYTGVKDVTELVKNFSDGADQQGSPPTYGNGNAIYTVGHVDATKGIDGGDYQLAHAGWALIIVYTSPNTYGHQLYLYDRFTYADDLQDLDFDKNGTPGGDISGFIVPERVRNDNGQLETDAAKITCFVGEGDNWITGEFIALNAPEQYWDMDTVNYPPSVIPTSYKLWDGYDTSSKNNVWNSLSPVCSADGVDVDTFVITWESGLISEGDTTAHVDMYTNSDNWNLVFMILAFRSETTTGGSLSYLIRG